MEGKTLMTARELADELNLSVDTIWRYTREKRIPFVELGSKQYRYNLKSVISALEPSKVIKEQEVVKEQEAEYMLKQDGQYTYQDYLKMPDEPGFKLEILDGYLVKEPAPNIVHQSIIGKLYLVFHGYFEKYDPEGYVFLSPLDVTLRDISVVQPDLIYIAGGKNEFIEKNRIDGPPTLAVEVISPSSRRKDRMQKLQIYQREGVEHYFIIDPEDETLECYQLKDGIYSLVASGFDDDVVSHPVYVGLDISLSPLWEKPYREP